MAAGQPGPTVRNSNRRFFTFRCLRSETVEGNFGLCISHPLSTSCDGYYCSEWCLGGELVGRSRLQLAVKRFSWWTLF